MLSTAHESPRCHERWERGGAIFAAAIVPNAS
jgi:hypothetical protein